VCTDYVKEIYDEIDGLLEYSRNIKRIGHLPKKEYYKLLSNCASWFTTDFPEISCINAIEAQYNGCLVITSDKYAVTETVKSKTKVKSHIELESNDYIEEFLSYLDVYKDDKFDEEACVVRKL
jgi:glycosyltransferase involved in cell wall biosynthesis